LKHVYRISICISQKLLFDFLKKGIYNRALRFDITLSKQLPKRTKIEDNTKHNRKVIVIEYGSLVLLIKIIVFPGMRQPTMPLYSFSHNSSRFLPCTLSVITTLPNERQSLTMPQDRMFTIEMFVKKDNMLAKLNSWKGKPSRSIDILHEKTAASVLLKLFISGNEWCHNTDAP